MQLQKCKNKSPLTPCQSSQTQPLIQHSPSLCPTCPMVNLASSAATALKLEVTYVMKTTSHFPSFNPASSTFSKSISFCSNFSFPVVILLRGVTLRPYSPTLVKWVEDRSSFRTFLPVLKLGGAQVPLRGLLLTYCARGSYEQCGLA